MLQRTTSLLLLVLALSACSVGPSSDADFDEAVLTQEVTEALNSLTAAMNAHDPDQVFTHYRQDESFFFLGCTDVLPGWGTFASRVGPFYTFETEVTFQREILSVQILSPTTAVAALRGSSTEVEALFWTEVLQKGDDGRWLITYEHESWPDCSTPRPPHMGTEGMPGGMGGDPSATPTSPGAH
jgi:ketosteroid isomerase-like protein